MALYKVSHEIKMAGTCPNPWQQRGVGWRCNGERYPLAVERERLWFEWAATQQGIEAIALKKACDASRKEIDTSTAAKTRVSVSLELAGQEICQEQLSKIKFPD